MLAYFDCFSGISGDMTLGAFIDLGVPVKWLKDSIRKIPLTGFDLSSTSITRNGIQAKRVLVQIKDEAKKARDYAEIKTLIKDSPFTTDVKDRSFRIFERLAEAEAGIHGCPKEKVHFHEIGGVDSIIDIIGTALSMEYLGIEKVIASKIPLGTGFVSCQHGTLPVPAPATIAILKGIPVYGSGIQHELVTPTGAAILATLSESFEEIPDMIVEEIGYGAGERDLKTVPNLLRIITGTMGDVQKAHQSGYLKDTIEVVETCIDDMNPEIFGFVMDRLFADGALDVYWMPVFMKKNRPGTMIHVLCHRNQRETIIHRILSETTSLGLRYYHAERRLLPRDHIHIKTPYGSLQVKRITNPDGSMRIVPEYEVCKKIALDKNIPIKVVYDAIIKAAEP